MQGKHNTNVMKMKLEVVSSLYKKLSSSMQFDAVEEKVDLFHATGSG
jgi:hypothetical protein